MDELWAENDISVERNHDINRWCDSCKAQYGFKRDKDTGEIWWHPKAQRMAYWIITSKVFNSGAIRKYCLSCINELENIDRNPYPIQDQLRDAQKLDKFWKLSTAVGKVVDND